MGKNEKLFDKIMAGNADSNINFNDLLNLLLKLGYILERITGSHHLLQHPDFNDIINIQKKGNKAKAYQVKQIRMILKANDIKL